MANDVNKVEVSGEVTRTWPRDSSYGLSLKVSSETNGKTYSNYIDVVAFKPLCTELDLNEGDRITVKGALRSSSYEKNGQKIWKTSVVAFEVKTSGDKPRHADDDDSPF